MKPTAAPSERASTKPLYYDAHQHLQDEGLRPYRDRVLEQLTTLPLEGGVTNGTHEGDWSEVAELADQHRWIAPSFGLHPWWVGQRSADWLNQLERYLQKYPRAGVGEIGLDRWILERARPDDPRLVGLTRASLVEQKDVFTTQLQLAVRLERAATLHCLEAWGPMWEIVINSPSPARGFLLHAYGGPPEMVASFARRGAYFSFNGSFLGERKERQRYVFQTLPLERLLIETDAPAMALPVTWRTHKLPPGPGGTILNHPGNIEAVYAGLAALRGISVAELSRAIAANFHRLFG